MQKMPNKRSKHEKLPDYAVRFIGYSASIDQDQDDDDQALADQDQDQDQDQDDGDFGGDDTDNA
jgi:hypothetical protein